MNSELHIFVLLLPIYPAQNIPSFNMVKNHLVLDQKPVETYT